MKYLFLDIDGVLNSSCWYRSTKDEATDIDLDPKCIELLNQIIIETDCIVILSSDWRYDFVSACNRLYLAGLIKDSIKDRTDILTEDISRGKNIQNYINRHLTKGDTYCIVDDRTDMLKCQLSNFRYINPYCGLCQDDTNAIIKILEHV